MNNVPFQSDFDEKHSGSLPSDYFDFTVLRKSIYENLNVSSCSFEDILELLQSTDLLDLQEALKIIAIKRFPEALPYLERIFIENRNPSLRSAALSTIKLIGGPEASKILNRLRPRTIKSVDDLIKIALYDEDLGEREDAVRKLMLRRGKDAREAIKYLEKTEHREFILSFRRRDDHC